MTTVKIRPLTDRVLIAPDRLPEVTNAGIFVPGTVKEKPNRGTVIVTGPGTREKPITVQPGNKVIYGKYAGMPYKEDGVEYLLIRETDIFTII